MSDKIKPLLAAFSLLAATAYSQPEAKGREYYVKLHEEACELCDVGKTREALYKWSEIARWTSGATNEVLYYKCAGNMLRIWLEWLDCHEHITQKGYDNMMILVKRIEKLENAEISPDAWGQTKKSDLIEFGKDAKKRLLAAKYKISEKADEVAIDRDKNNPYEMSVPVGALRGIATTIMSPCNIFMAWPASLELETDIWLFYVLPVGGTGIAVCYIVKDLFVGVADMVTLGWAGNKIYDEETSPWWWQRFAGKTKAVIFR